MAASASGCGGRQAFAFAGSSSQQTARRRSVSTCASVSGAGVALARGEAYSSEAPTMWDVDFQTAVAQAEVEDRPTRGAFHDIAFGVEGGDASFVIATTRPELLPACVGVTAHPDDARYKALFGRRARRATPRSFPWSRVRKLTIRSASRRG